MAASMLDDNANQPQANMANIRDINRGTISIQIRDFKLGLCISKEAQWHYRLDSQQKLLIFTKRNKANKVTQEQQVIDLTQCSLFKIDNNKYGLNYNKQLIFDLTPKKWDQRHVIYFHSFIRKISRYCKSSDVKNCEPMREFINLIYKAASADRKLGEFLNKIKLKNKKSGIKQACETGLRLRQQFWNLLRETAGLLKDDEDDAFEICANLEKWPDLEQLRKQQNPTVSVKDQEIMNIGCDLIKKVSSNYDKQVERERLRRNWQDWTIQFNQLRNELDDLKPSKWKKQAAFGCGVLLMVGGVAATIFTCGGSLSLTLGIGILLIDEALLFGTGVVLCGIGAKLESEEAYIEQIDESLDMAAKYAPKFQLWLDQMMEHIKSADRWIGTVHDEDDGLDFDNLRIIGRLRSEMEQWCSLCKETCDAVRTVQKQIVSCEFNCKF